MKQISARVFRVTFPKLTEPMQVSTRGEGGIIRILGTWTPRPAETIDLGPNASPADVERVRERFTPVPKPGKR